MPAGKIFLASKAKRRSLRTKRRMRLPYRLRRRMLQPQVRVQRTFWLSNWTPSTATTNDFWRYYSFNLTLMPDYTQFATIFDTYKLHSFTLILRPRYDSFAGNDTTDTTLPGITNQGGNSVHVIIDPSSTVSPSGAYTTSTLNSFLEHGRVRSYQGNRPIYIKCKYPCYIDDVNNTPGSDYKRSNWFNTNANGVSLRGIHAFVQDVNMTGNFGQSYDVFMQCDISFKGMK